MGNEEHDKYLEGVTEEKKVKMESGLNDTRSALNLDLNLYNETVSEYTGDYGNETAEVNGTAFSVTTPTRFCAVWEEAQHSLFQTANMFLAAAFIVPKNFKQNILLVRFLLSIGFLLTAIWGGFSVCGPDILSWNIILSIVNLGHTISLTMRFLPPRLNAELTDLYLKQFKPLKVGKKHFKELTKEAQIHKLESGESYAIEDVTPADEKLSILLRGKLKVSVDEIHLHYIYPHQFIDSPEWEAFRESNADIFQDYRIPKKLPRNKRKNEEVTIQAEEDSLYLTWPRLRLERILRHRIMLRQVFESMIGKDITHKLYSLNEHLGGLKHSEDERFKEVCRKNLNRSLSLDAVHIGRNGNVRSQAWRRSEDLKGYLHHSELSPVKSRQAHMFLPIVASHFPKEYPFVQVRPMTHSDAYLPLSQTAKSHAPIITEEGRLNIPPAPAAPVALVPVMVPVLGSSLPSASSEPSSSPLKKSKSSKAVVPPMKKIFSRDKEVKFETPV